SASMYCYAAFLMWLRSDDWRGRGGGSGCTANMGQPLGFGKGLGGVLFHPVLDVLGNGDFGKGRDGSRQAMGEETAVTNGTIVSLFESPPISGASAHLRRE